MSQGKMYVIVRRDLSKAYQTVQACHAVAQYTLEHGDYRGWKNGIMVVLGVDSEGELKEWVDTLLDADKEFSCFAEDDLDFQMTAIACVDDGKIFSDLRLL